MATSPAPPPPPPPPHESPPHRALPWVIGASLIIAVFAAYFPALTAEFVNFDDPHFVTDNPHIRGFSQQNIIWAFTQFRGGHWHPLTWLSWMLDYTLWGGYSAAGFHLNNIALHAACAVLVYLLATRLLTIARSPALAARETLPPSSTHEHLAGALAAAIFALHPMRVESVAWVTERRDVLSAVFLLASAYAYITSVRQSAPGLRSVPWFIAAVALLAISLLAKAWGMTFFAVMLALDIFPLRRVSLDRGTLTPRQRIVQLAHLFIEKLPFLLLGLAAAVLAANAQHTGFASKTLTEWGIHDRAAQSVYGLAWYLWKSAWPVDLSVLYELPLSMRFSQPRVIFAILTLLAIAACSLVRRFRLPILAAGAAYVILLAPVLGILQSGEQLVADRYSVLASVPVVLLIAWLALQAISSQPVRSSPVLTKAACAGAVVVVLALAMLTFSQAVVWRSTLALWSHALDVTPTPGVRMNYAIELVRLGRQKDAIDEMLIVAKERPTDPRVWFMLAEDARRRGKFDDAARFYKQSAATSPQPYMALVNLGGMQMSSLNDLPGAIESFKAAIADVEKGTFTDKGGRPISYLPYLALGDALAKSGNPAAARAAFTKALQGEDTKASAEAELKKLGG